MSRSIQLNLLLGNELMERRKNVLCIPGAFYRLEMHHILSAVMQSNNDEQDTKKFSIDAPGMREMADICSLNSKIKFDKMDVPFAERAILGDATETGLTRFAAQYIPDYDEHQKSFPKVFEIPFNSSNKWALVIVSRLEFSF
jgi:magnesium-transporting ATPase (P-type)